MKFNPSSHWQKSAIVSTIILASASVVAFAQSAPPPPPGGPQAGRPGMERGLPRPDMNRQGEPGFFMSHQLAGLKTSLRLTPQQAALWDKAEKAMAPAPDARAKRQELAKARRDQALAALADPKFDPRKFAAEQEKQRAEMQAQAKTRMNAIKENWFSVYDSLDTAQRGQVREFLRARFEARGKVRGHRGAWGAHRGDLPGIRDGRPGMHEGNFTRQGAPAGLMPVPAPKQS